MKEVERGDFNETFYECFATAWKYAECSGNKELLNKLYTNPYRQILESLGYDLSFCKKNKEENS